MHLLTDEQLATEVRQAYENHMLLEMSGAAYSTAASANQAAAARSRYYELATEQDRRKAMAPVHYLTGKKIGAP
ncbi:MAG: hypothetical protein O3C34_20710 [Proteobacteria bacterium]|nr:hypothetical protein [Pseudomonadota bacterium]